MNRLSEDKQTMILRALCEGNSIRATARMVGCAKRTVSNLLRDVGAHCKNYHDRMVTDLDSERVQADELWQFCGAKEKNVPDNRRKDGWGDVWTWIALDHDSKLLISYRIGKRGMETAAPFLIDLRDRLKNRVQLTTDAYRVYGQAVEAVFGWDRIDYAQLMKLFAKPSRDAQARYSPPACIGIEKRWIMGQPDESQVCTSHVERFNLTLRMSQRRYTRLTNGFSKKLEYHLYAVALHAMFYNFCRVHKTLTKEAGGIKTTPAMAAGLAERPWTVRDLLDLLQWK